MNDFKNKTILITGASRGIGLACAKEFVERGATVITAQRGKADEFTVIQADFADTDCPEKVVAEVVNQTGRLDVLINNAGVMIEATAEQMHIDDWQKTLTINLTIPFLLIKHALPHLRQSKGSIVNIGSIEGLGSNPRHAAYCASKSGLHGLTKAIAVDCGADGVRCNAVAPGWIDTELNETFIESMEDPQIFRKSIGKIHPLNRTGTPEEVAKLVCFLASNEASFITGQIYIVDGGRTSKLSLP